jgi:hypothetical protein
VITDVTLARDQPDEEAERIHPVTFLGNSRSKMLRGGHPAFIGINARTIFRIG